MKRTKLTKKQIAEGWKPHKPGDKCPVKNGSLVEVLFRDGGVLSDTTPEWWGGWDVVKGEPRMEIVAYRAVEEPKASAVINDPSKSFKVEAGGRIEVDGWIEWKGGECPVPGDTIIEAKTRDGRVLLPMSATKRDWEHGRFSSSRFSSSMGGDIIAYRIVEKKRDRVDLAKKDLEQRLDLTGVEKLVTISLTPSQASKLIEMLLEEKCK